MWSYHSLLLLSFWTIRCLRQWLDLGKFFLRTVDHYTQLCAAPVWTTTRSCVRHLYGPLYAAVCGTCVDRYTQLCAAPVWTVVRNCVDGYMQLCAAPVWTPIRCCVDNMQQRIHTRRSSVRYRLGMLCSCVPYRWGMLYAVLCRPAGECYMQLCAVPLGNAICSAVPYRWGMLYAAVCGTAGECISVRACILITHSSGDHCPSAARNSDNFTIVFLLLETVITPPLPPCCWK